LNQYLLNVFSIIIQKIKWYDYTSQRQNNIDEEEKNGNSIKKSFPLSKKQLINIKIQIYYYHKYCFYVN